MIYILSWTTGKHQKNTFQATTQNRIELKALLMCQSRIEIQLGNNPILIWGHLKLKRIQGFFRDLHRNLRTFQGKMEFKDFSRTSPTVEGLFKTMRTLQTYNCKSLLYSKTFRSVNTLVIYLTPGVGAPCPVLVPGFFNDVPGPV